MRLLRNCAIVFARDAGRRRHIAWAERRLPARSSHSLAVAQMDEAKPMHLPLALKTSSPAYESLMMVMQMCVCALGQQAVRVSCWLAINFFLWPDNLDSKQASRGSGPDGRRMSLSARSLIVGVSLQSVMVSFSLLPCCLAIQQRTARQADSCPQRHLLGSNGDPFKCKGAALASQVAESTAARLQVRVRAVVPSQDVGAHQVDA